MMEHLVSVHVIVVTGEAREVICYTEQQKYMNTVRATSCGRKILQISMDTRTHHLTDADKVKKREQVEAEGELSQRDGCRIQKVGGVEVAASFIEL